MQKQTGRTLFWAAAGIGAVAAARMVTRQRRTLDFTGKVALITGGSRGLGLILARRLAQAGAKIAICGRDRETLARAREQLLEFSLEEVLALPCDVTDPDDIRTTVGAVMAEWGTVDILINNAGTIQVGPMAEMTDDDYDEAMKMHFWAPYRFIQHVLPTMQMRRAGRIVNIASVGGKVSVPHLLPYSTTKFALIGYSEGLRAELLKDNVYVTTVCPSLIRTGSPRNAFFKGQNEKEYTWFALGDSLPGASMSADTAADQIIDALRHGDAELITSLPAKAVSLLHGIFPGFTADLMGTVNRFLPAPGGVGTERRTGSESENPVTRSLLTALTRKAADKNNQP